MSTCFDKTATIQHGPSPCINDLSPIGDIEIKKNQWRITIERLTLSEIMPAGERQTQFAAWHLPADQHHYTSVCAGYGRPGS